MYVINCCMKTLNIQVERKEIKTVKNCQNNRIKQKLEIYYSGTKNASNIC